MNMALKKPSTGEKKIFQKQSMGKIARNISEMIGLRFLESGVFWNIILLWDCNLKT